MKSLLRRMKRSPRLGRVLLALSLPVFVTIGFAPLWAVALSIVSILLAAIFMYAEVLSPKFVQSAQSQNSITLAKITNAKFAQSKSEPEPFAPLPSPTAATAITTAATATATMNQAQIKHWLSYGNDAVKAISGAQSEIREALRMSTSSALEIGHSVQKMQANHEAQSQLTKNLLEQTENGKSQEPSLADLAAAAAYTLKRQADQIAITAENASVILERQQMTNLIALRADDLLADADKLGKQSEVLDPLEFAQNYRNTIRELRSGLDAIRQSLAQVNQDLQSNVDSLKNVMSNGPSEVDVIANSIQQKLDETRKTMGAINVISRDTEEHIHSAIVAMQYNDITSQKFSAIDSRRLQQLLAHTQSILANTYKQNPELLQSQNLDNSSAAVASKVIEPSVLEKPALAVEIFE